MPSHDRLRIALFTYSTQPRGGVLHALALAEALYDMGHRVVLHALDDSGRGFIRTPRCACVFVPVEPSRAAILPFVRGRVAAYVDAWDAATPAFDVYHAHDGISGNALATLVERGVIADFVRTVHHLDDFGTPEMAALQARAIVSARRVLVVSELWREHLAAEYGIAAARVSNGVDLARFGPPAAAERAQLRARLGYGTGPLFVTIGGVEARKNTLRTLEAFARVRARLPDARLVIAGGASVLDHSAYRRAFDVRAAELRLCSDPSIELAGVLPDERIVALLRAAHVFVFPSLIEGFGLVLLEALACGTPVVTSALRPFTEFLQPGDALLVDPHDSAEIARAMLHALEPPVAAVAQQRGPAVARRYSWAASARAHVAAYGFPSASQRATQHA
jgi:glycosyltransferase-like protein